jgi:hypothetical protein
MWNFRQLRQETSQVKLDTWFSAEYTHPKLCIQRASGATLFVRDLKSFKVKLQTLQLRLCPKTVTGRQH